MVWFCVVIFFPFPPLVAGATSEGVLANFFNSLLSKKTGSPGGPGGVGGSPGGGGTGGAGSNLPPSVKKSGMNNDKSEWWIIPISIVYQRYEHYYI